MRLNPFARPRDLPTMPEYVPAAPLRSIWMNDDGTLDRTDLLALSDQGTAASRRANRTDADTIALYGAVYAAMRRRVRMIGAPRITLMRNLRGGKRVEMPNHPALVAVQRVNGGLTGKQGLGLLEQHKLAAGMALWVKRRNPLGVPVEFEVWNPYEVEIVADAQKPWQAKAYRRWLRNGDKVTVDATDVIPFRHMIDPRPGRILYGLGAIGAVRVQIDTGYEAQRWNLKFFDNGALPSALLTGEAGQGEMNRIAQTIARYHRGTDKAHSVLALEGDLKLLQAPISHDDMQFLEQMNWSKTEVYTAFELSVIPANNMTSGTFSNYDQAEASDWAMMRDNLNGIIDELNEWYVHPDFGPEFDLVALYDDIPALQADRKRQAEIDQIRLNAGVMVINEVRERDGLDDVPWGKLPIMPATMMPLNLNPQGQAEQEPGKGEPPKPEEKPATEKQEELPAPRSLPTRSLEGESARLEDETNRVLRIEMRRLFAYLEGLPELTPGAVDAHDWRGWYDRHAAALADELVRVMLTALSAAEYPANPLVNAQQLAVQYARGRVSDLLYLNSKVSISETTRERVRDLVADTLEKGESLRWLKNRLREDGLSFGKARAETIARAETATAIGQAKLQAFAQIGHQGKRWRTAGATADNGEADGPCRLNERQGPIPLSRPFQSGHVTIPAHIRCRCTILPVNRLDDPTTGPIPVP